MMTIHISIKKKKKKDLLLVVAIVVVVKSLSMETQVIRININPIAMTANSHCKMQKGAVVCLFVSCHTNHHHHHHFQFHQHHWFYAENNGV